MWNTMVMALVVASKEAGGGRKKCQDKSIILRQPASLLYLCEKP